MFLNKIKYVGMYSYPEIEQLQNDSLLYNKNCYYIENYKPGLSLYSDVDMNIIPTYWDKSERMLIDDLFSKSLEIHHKITKCLVDMGVKTIQTFFDDDSKIIDIVANDDFVSPGMLKDIINNKFEIQNVLAQGVLDAESLSKMIEDYKTFIIKPMTRFCYNNDKSKPYYARIL